MIAILLPSLRYSMTFPICLIIFGWIPSVGSSSKRSLGFPNKALAIASCCCCPPLRSPPFLWRKSFKIGNRKIGYDYDPLVIAEIGINHGVNDDDNIRWRNRIFYQNKYLEKDMDV